MIRLRCDLFSEALQLSTSMTVLLPQAVRSQVGVVGGVRQGGTPVLYLLHGLSDDDTAWTRYTSIERYAERLGLAVVMPQVHRSFYADMVEGGGKYWTFLNEELPQIVVGSFVVSNRREDTFVAGLSMGGYGAMKLALRQPDRFAAAGSLSGALDVAALAASGDRDDLFRNVWGAIPPSGNDEDLLHLLDRADPGSLPALWLTCGTEDVLLGTNHSFVRRARAAGVEIAADFAPGEHEWGFWDTHIQRFLDWLPLAPLPQPQLG